MAVSTFTCIDGHTCGNPVRVVAGGGPLLEGATMLERRAHFIAEYDWIRTGLMFEPRGHDMMSGAILYPPTREDCDTGILYIETSGCLPMCGHGTIGTITIGIENGLIRPREPGVVRLDTPAGLVVAEYEQQDRFVEKVRLTNVPSFLHARDVRAEVPGLGELTVDIAYGGNFYAIVEPQDAFRDIADHTAGDLIGWSRALRAVLNAGHDIVHPEKPEISGLRHILWTGAPTKPEAHARNAVFYGEKAIDRSPCGTGTSARMAHWHALGRLKAGDAFVHESIIGSMFEGRVEAETEVAGRPAIVPSIAGWARVTGYNTIQIDDRDPYAHGFVVV
ncbi:4-hydroxyproline epimerase [Nitratireductor pacificus]|uniref:Hydroxyproline-2-epimerase n=1 Tax=Nitratireductor pacificus pht-3B TaxID=391937 RepID=K2MQB6_9HYPH|nr:4-hydroxyproline epimerase [Nitratireductor pacificus]EKF19502.1 hydroxyproline-2-epimerase [Nitratireductor pacificus pht-3B]